MVTMPRRSHKFRQGDRAEYLAQFLLSRIAQTIPVPRQEDWGEDYVCALLIPEGDMLLHGTRFRVQVKASRKELAKVVGGYTEGRWRTHEVQWLLGRGPYPVGNDPLFLAVCDGEALELYAPFMMWWLRYRVGQPTEIEFKPGADPMGPTCADKPCRPATKRARKRRRDPGDGRRWEVPLGDPIVRLDRDLVSGDDHVIRPVREAIDAWCQADRKNRFMAAMNIPLVYRFWRWTTNAPPHGAVE